MTIAPHENLTITLLRRNLFSDLRLQGAAPRRAVRMTHVTGAHRAGVAAAVNRPSQPAERFPWNIAFPYDPRGVVIDVMA